AEEEQQMIRPIENVKEPFDDETARRLEPARIEPHESGIVVKRECAFGTIWRQKPKRCLHSNAQSHKVEMDRKRGVLRLDVVLEQRVHEPLLRQEVEIVLQARSADVIQRRFVR